jgi:AbrB family looped-hinge helix DNA binding protein
MQTTRMTSKGQLVIPKSVRDALHLRSGTDFDVHVEGSRIVLEARHPKGNRLGDWQGFNPKGIRLSTDELCAAVSDYQDDEESQRRRRDDSTQS